MDRSHSYKNDYDTQSIRSFRSSTSGSVSEPGRTEAMSLARPRTDQEIEDRFVDFMNNMGMHEPEQRKATIGLTVDNKWKLIYQHESQEQTKAKKREERYIDKSSSEHFVRKLQLDPDLKVTDSKFLLALFISLKSQPISRDADLAMELEIVKCMKTLFNNRWGAQEAIKHSACITSLCFSITSPHLQTRKLVVEVLTFLCYCEVLMGHKLVLEGLDIVMEYWKENARFDAWMRILENTIDGRGRFGTMVGISEELKKAGTLDGQLIEYVVVDEIELRVHLRSQLTTSGLTRIISKMRDMKHDLIDRQLNIYEDEAENDYEDMIEFYNHQILHDMSDPYDVFRALLRSVESSRAYDFFLSLLQHMLLIREEGDLRIRYFQLMDAIVTQVLGISVNQLVGKLVDQDRPTQAIEDSKQARQELELVIRQTELEVGQKDDGMVSQLKANIYSLEDLFRLSRHTIQTLQAKLYDVETQMQNKRAIQDAQLKHLLKSLQDANGLMTDAGMSAAGAGSLGSGKGNQHQIMGPDGYPMIDKVKLRQLIEQTKLVNGYQYTGQATLPPELLDGIAAAGGQSTGGGKGERFSKIGKGSGDSVGSGSGSGEGGPVPGRMVTSSGGPPVPPPPPMLPGGIPAPPPPPPVAAGPGPGGLGGLLNSMKKGGGDDSDSEDPPSGSMAAMLAAKKKLGSGEPSSPKAAASSGAPPPPKAGGPPPPPPPGKGGPPSPPEAPMPGMDMNMKKEGAVAAIKLKALQWDKINYMAVGNTKALGESGVFGTMEQIFVAKTTEYKDQHCAGGMKHTYPEIRQAILRMDEEFMTLAQLSNLLKFVPDGEETGKPLEYKDASEDVKLTLGRPEAFFVEMLKVERYHQRLEGLKLRSPSKASSRLVDTKASNVPNMNLLHFLTNITESTMSHVLAYQQEVSACGTACRDLQTDFNHLKTKIKEIKTELHTHYINGFMSSPEDRFYEIMQPFMVSAEKAFVKADSAMLEMDSIYKEVVKFYGEDSVAMKPEEFFGIFKTFTASF
ncbi:hypothetical protein BGW39_009803 [Mortierella sp. 14UC]|nr:hypothetical protein BGW39_009803 [Mortierella sp. 14UC]